MRVIYSVTRHNVRLYTRLTLAESFQADCRHLIRVLRDIRNTYIAMALVLPSTYVIIQADCGVLSFIFAPSFGSKESSVLC